MKKLITVIIILYFVSFSAHSQSINEVNEYVTNFLSKHDSRIGSDTLIVSERNYHVILLQKIKSTKTSIYQFAFNILHYSTNFILIIDNKKNTWVVFGQNDLLLEIKSLTTFFSETPRIKKSVIIECYNYLIDNFQSQGKWINIDSE